MIMKSMEDLGMRLKKLFERKTQKDSRINANEAENVWTGLAEASTMKLQQSEGLICTITLACLKAKWRSALAQWGIDAGGTIK